MWAQNILGVHVVGVPLWVILLCGLAGVLVDIDDFIAYYWLTTLDARFLHTPLLIVSCVVLCGCCAYIGGLFCWMVLK